ncbi:MAG: glutaredoxin family protein [Bacillota bacterium]
MTALVVLYSHRGCPGGEAAQRHMDEQGIAYQMRDVLKDLEARAEFQRLGGIGTPLLQVGEHLLHGFDPDEFEAILSQAEGRPAHG